MLPTCLLSLIFSVHVFTPGTSSLVTTSKLLKFSNIVAVLVGLSDLRRADIRASYKSRCVDVSIV